MSDRIGRQWAGLWRTALAGAFAFAVAALGAAAFAQGADPDATRERLKRLEAELTERAAHQRQLAQEADAAGREAEALARRVVAAAAEVQALEERVAAIAIKTESLNEMLAEEKAALEVRRTQMAQTLAALQRLSRRPTDLALLRPGDADATIKSAILLRELMPQLEEQARDIRMRVERMQALRSELAAEQERLQTELAALDTRRSELDRLRAQREDERRRYLSEAEAEARRVAALAAEAEDMEELLAGLERERQRRLAAARDAADRLAKPAALPEAPPAAAPFSTARGTLPLPARGRLIRGYGEKGDIGREKGITIATVDGAQVVAPYDGQVAFSGPFRGYGQLLIIAHGEGYHTLLAGMDRIYATVGQWVLAGEPVGAMAANSTANSSVNEMPQLYVELRKGGDPVNPLPWLAASLGKVS